MENSKYYTPEISEFHVGFEYEMKRGFQDGTVKSQEDFDSAEWEKRTCSLSGDPYIDRALNGKNAENGRCGIRVKCLDRDDIESCGWKPLNRNPFIYTVESGMNVYSLRIFEDTRLVEIAFGVDKDRLNTFYGTIRNKSELKKLMQQLNIK
ncbi:MAG: hypothetical protein V4721_10300 [Bacteroidota bacterium]